MTTRILTLRELNRATLARQMLLQRETISIPATIERLAGMQAQLASAPFVGLWTRLENFKREELATELTRRNIVKASLMRATLHLFSAADFIHYRTTLQTVLDLAGDSIVQQRGAEFDRKKLLTAGQKFIAQKPRTFAEITAMVSELMPDVDVGALRYTVRTKIPLVQVPIASEWSFSSKPEFALAQEWIGKIDTKDYLPELVKRYLAAFGPASVTDAQSWLGLKLKEVFEKLRPELITYKDETRRELFDLPDAPLPDADTIAPIRFLPEFDNILLSHNNRKRIVTDEFRKQVYLPALRVAATILVDGFVRAAWKVEKAKTVATLIIEPFEKITKKDRTEIAGEAEQLVRFIVPNVKSYEIKFVES